jgi:hypothetical protein
MYRMASAFRLGFRCNQDAVWPISADPNLNGWFIRGSGWRGHIGAMRRQFLIGALATALCAILSLPVAGQRRRRGRNPGGGQRRNSRPPGDIMDSVARRYSGKILGADRARRGGRPIYRLKVLTDGGNVLSVEADAATGEVLSVRGGGR